MDASIAELYYDAWESITHAPQEAEEEMEYPEQWESEPQLVDQVVDANDPFVALEAFQEAWRRKDHETPWSTEIWADLDLGDLEWQTYEPPAALNKSPTVSSQILLDIIPTSIANVRRRIAEEARQEARRKEGEAAEEKDSRRRAEEEAVSGGKDKGKQPLRHDVDQGESSTMAMSRRQDQDAQPGTISSTSSAHGKLKKRRKFSIHSLLHRSQGEFTQRSPGPCLAHRDTLRQTVGAILTSLHLSSADGKILEIKTRPFWASSPQNDVEVECVSCLDDFTAKETIKVPCNHNYCRECFVRLISASIQNEQQWPPKCCLNNVPFKTIDKTVPDDIKRRFHERSSEWGIPINERVYCHDPGCGVWVRPSRIDLARCQGRCERNHVTCTVCRGQAHGNADCPQDRDLDMTNRLAEEEGWKRCYSCRALVEHKEACQHMTCRCGAEFCYVCGLVWQTCRCTMDDLQAVKQAADDRRYQRHFREQTEARELQQILRQIQEFEHQERLQAEAERLERQRIEEENWQRELVERTKEELMRRIEVECKFEQLRVIMDELHELQMVMMECRQDDEARSLRKEAKEAKHQLQQEHEASRASLKEKHETGTMQKEKEVAKQLAIRVTVEKQLEQEYQAELEAFWANKDRGNEAIQIAMLTLRQRMDKAYLAWDKWEKGQLESYRAELDAERLTQEKELEAARQQVEMRYQEDEAERTRRELAEKRWIQEVILERERLLKGMEVEEMESDVDSIFAGVQEWPLTS